MLKIFETAKNKIIPPGIQEAQNYSNCFVSCSKTYFYIMIFNVLNYMKNCIYIHVYINYLYMYVYILYFEYRVGPGNFIHLWTGSTVQL